MNETPQDTPDTAIDAAVRAFMETTLSGAKIEIDQHAVDFYMVHGQYYPAIKAAIDAYTAHLKAQGLAIVPMEPTEAMLEAACKAEPCKHESSQPHFAERERCAEIADKIAEQHVPKGYEWDGDEWDEAAECTAREIANRIRGQL